jgi:hypothetical protein
MKCREIFTHGITHGEPSPKPFAMFGMYTDGCFETRDVNIKVQKPVWCALYLRWGLHGSRAHR